MYNSSEENPETVVITRRNYDELMYELYTHRQEKKKEEERDRRAAAQAAGFRLREVPKYE